MRTGVILVLVVTTLAGCAGDETLDGATSTVELAVVDDADQEIQIDLSGAWLRKGANDTWSRIAEQGSTILGAEGGNLSATVPAGRYDALRVVVANVTVDGTPAILAENGFELPINVTLRAGSVTQMIFGFAWADAVFTTNEGLSFQPVLKSIDVVRDGEPLLSLAAKDIQIATKNPVARMEVYDARNARVFETDFIAESPKRYAVAQGPNITFQASGSEAVEKGAALSKFEWTFGDGTTAEGPTVSHLYPLSGGKFTARLMVTDSNGVSDSQTVKLALAPGILTAKQRFDGTITGAYPSSCTTSTTGSGMKTHTLPIEAGQTPDGTPADLIRVQVNLYAVGNPHAGANINLRVLNHADQSMGTSESSGTTEEVGRDFSPGTAESGDWTLEVKPCAAYDLDYEIVGALTWLAKEPSPGYLEWLSNYDDGHDHQH